MITVANHGSYWVITTAEKAAFLIVVGMTPTSEEEDRSGETPIILRL